MKTLLNLYDEIRPRQVRFGLDRLLQVSLALLALVVLWAVYTSAQVRDLAGRRAALEAQAQALTPQIEALESELAADSELAQLRARIDRMQVELQARERMLALMGDLHAAPGHGFSARLEALARSTVQGLWLTRVELREGGLDVAPQVRLLGRLQTPTALPQLLDALARQPAFAGQRFAQIEVAENAGGEVDADSASRGRLGFELRSVRASEQP